MPPSEENIAKAIAGARVLFKNNEDRKAEVEDLLRDDEAQPVFISFTFENLSLRAHPKELRIGLPHPFWTAPEQRVCVIVPKGKQRWKAAIGGLEVGSLKKVLTLNKLRKKWCSDFSNKRELAGRFDLFLTDHAVVPYLPSLLGKPFVGTKKMPKPVRLDRTNGWRMDLEAALKSTWCRFGRGDNGSVRIGRAEMSNEELAANASKALAAVVAKGEGIEKPVLRAWVHLSPAGPPVPIFTSDVLKERVTTAIREATQPRPRKLRKNKREGEGGSKEKKAKLEGGVKLEKPKKVLKKRVALNS